MRVLSSNIKSAISKRFLVDKAAILLIEETPLDDIWRRVSFSIGLPGADLYYSVDCMYGSRNKILLANVKFTSAIH